LANFGQTCSWAPRQPPPGGVEPSLNNSLVCPPRNLDHHLFLQDPFHIHILWDIQKKSAANRHIEGGSQYHTHQPPPCIIKAYLCLQPPALPSAGRPAWTSQIALQRKVTLTETSVSTHKANHLFMGVAVPKYGIFSQGPPPSTSPREQAFTNPRGLYLGTSGSRPVSSPTH
jgi:hypothetical protein